MDELKEFLYVDVDRVRSLLSQLAGGLIEETRSSSGDEMTGEAQALVFGVGARGDFTRNRQHEEARSFQDLTFVAFERLANERGYIAEMPDAVFDPEQWSNGHVHSLLLPGQLLRVECEVQLLDGSFFDSRVKRFISLAEAMVDMALEGTPASAGGGTAAGARNIARARETARAQALAALMSGTSPAQLDAISRAVQSFVGDSISLRVLPCGIQKPEFAFTGALLGRKEYIQEEREHLFSRYGQAPSNWVSVLHVAAVPTETSSTPALADSSAEEGDDVDAPEDVDQSAAIDRADMEKTMSELLGMMEEVGIVEGPRWPSISVTPLGIYRVVPGPF